MASLWALLPAPDAHSAYEWLTRLARGLGAGDPRGMDARRADLFTQLLTGQLTWTTDDPNSAAASVPVASGKPLIQVVVPHSTLTGADDQPCELLGYGPIPAGLAREIAADAVWTRLLTDPASGALLDHGRTVYHPPAALADFVRARDNHCRLPICRRRAATSELDHIIPFPEGTTSDENLCSECVLHHKMKHSPGWQVHASSDGRIRWTTPTGHRYTSETFDYRPEPPPAARNAPTATPVPALPDEARWAWNGNVSDQDVLDQDADPPPF